MPTTPAATFCATLTDEWIRNGVRHAVIAPGSRSTPLALALVARPELHVEVVHDERAASFVALGIGVATGRPAVLLCTSGTAAAEFHAAVVEAHQGEVPMVVCTADRPPELRDVGAPQTIDQWRLYGPAVRWFHDPGAPDDAQAPTWRAVAARSVAEATSPRPGPVHLNLPFRDPLVGEPGALPPGRADGAPWLRTLGGPAGLDDTTLAELTGVLDRQRGVVVAGGGPGVRAAADAVHELAGQLGWPVLADPRSGCRTPRATTVAAFDAVLRNPEFAAAHAPEVVLRIGTQPASKVLAEWITASGAVEVQLHATAAWLDPNHRAGFRVVADPATVLGQLAGRMRGAGGTPWLARWRRAEHRAQAVLDEQLGDGTALVEPAVARAVAAAAPDGATLVVSSSMPVRDVEWYAAPRDGLTVHANRGANGIDGVIATAIGVAVGSGRPTVLLIGDLAFVHDSAALVALARRRLDLSIVVVDNDGGGIFSFLPQAAALPGERFEQLFGTPHGSGIAQLAAAHGLAVTELDDRAELVHWLARRGIGIGVVRSDRGANVAVHDALHRAVRAAVG